MVIWSSQNGLLGQVRRVPALSCLFFNRGIRAASLESQRNEESYAGSQKKELVESVRVSVQRRYHHLAGDSSLFYLDSWSYRVEGALCRPFATLNLLDCISLDFM